MHSAREARLQAPEGRPRPHALRSPTGVEPQGLTPVAVEAFTYDQVGPPSWRRFAPCWLPLCAAYALVSCALLARRLRPGPPPGQGPAQEETRGVGLRLADRQPGAGVNSTAEDVCSFGDPLWLEYADLHRRSRAELEQGRPGRALLWHCMGGEVCNGLADEMKGLASALYIAMLTGRALFLLWERHGQDLAALLGPSARIDWRPPGWLPNSCTPLRRNESFLLRGSDLAQLVLENSAADCVSVQANGNPRVLQGALGSGEAWVPAAVQSASEALGELLPRFYMVGCAMNFLFSFTPAYRSLAEHVRVLLSPGLGAVPERFVAVHLRFGDQGMQGSDSPNSEMVQEALACGAELAREVLGLAAGGAVFFTSDSAAARREALQSPPPLLLFETADDPIHISAAGGADARLLWRALGDFLVLARAEGLVQCWDEARRCGFSPYGHSGFSLVAAQQEFLPVDRYREVTSGGCSRHELYDF